MMWIRGQVQKENGRTTYAGLVCCRWFSLRDYGDKYIIDGGINDPGEDDGFWLGEYPAETEALQVLNMIEGDLGRQTVFQMPEAGFLMNGGEDR